MLADADLSSTAELMTGHRATMLLAMIGGRELSAGELASRAGISRSLASAHLSRLLDGGLVAVVQRGRRRDYRLAGPQVAQVLEAMLTLAPHRAATGLAEARRGDAIRRARTCYDHLAGELGVAVTEALERHGLLRAHGDGYELTESGRLRMAELGLDVDALRARRRAFARPCLDWTERRPHLAGALGAALADRMLELGWVERRSDSRGLRVTDAGRRGLREELMINLVD